MNTSYIPRCDHIFRLIYLWQFEFTRNLQVPWWTFLQYFKEIVLNSLVNRLRSTQNWSAVHLGHCTYGCYQSSVGPRSGVKMGSKCVLFIMYCNWDTCCWFMASLEGYQCRPLPYIYPCFACQLIWFVSWNWGELLYFVYVGEFPYVYNLWGRWEIECGVLYHSGVFVSRYGGVFCADPWLHKCFEKLFSNFIWKQHFI